MKYIKSYKLYEADVNQIESDDKDTHTLVDAKNRLNQYIKDTNEYNSKKKQLDNLILNNKTNQNIDENIKKLIGENKILSMYLPVVHIKKTINDLENKIKYDNDSIQSRKSDLGNTNNLLDITDKSTQVTNLNSQIAEIQKRISDNNKDLGLLKNQLLKEENAIKAKIETGKKDIESLIKKISTI